MLPHFVVENHIREAIKAMSFENQLHIWYTCPSQLSRTLLFTRTQQHQHTNPRLQTLFVLTLICIFSLQASSVIIVESVPWGYVLRAPRQVFSVLNEYVRQIKLVGETLACGTCVLCTYVLCTMNYELCPYVLCTVYLVLCTMYLVLCSTSYVTCTFLCVTCPM